MIELDSENNTPFNNPIYMIVVYCELVDNLWQANKLSIYFLATFYGAFLC